MIEYRYRRIRDIEIKKKPMRNRWDPSIQIKCKRHTRIYYGECRRRPAGYKLQTQITIATGRKKLQGIYTGIVVMEWRWRKATLSQCLYHIYYYNLIKNKWEINLHENQSARKCSKRNIFSEELYNFDSPTSTSFSPLLVLPAAATAS
jgi:hypothetical protein